MSTQTLNDPFDTISNPERPAREYYGKLTVQPWYCVLEKGVGRTPFDAQRHKLSQRRTAIDVFFDPLPEMNVTRSLEKKMLDSEPKWYGVTWPSARALGIKNARQLNGMWVKLEHAPTGKKYTGTDGSQVDETSFKLLAMYSDEATCRAAYLAEQGDGDNSVLTGSNGSTPAPTDPGRDTALQFLRVIVTNAARGRTPADARAEINIEITEKYKAIVGPYFNVDSPETAALYHEITGGELPAM